MHFLTVQDFQQTWKCAIPRLEAMNKQLRSFAKSTDQPSRKDNISTAEIYQVPTKELHQLHVGHPQILGPTTILNVIRKQSLRDFAEGFKAWT